MLEFAEEQGNITVKLDSKPLTQEQLNRLINRLNSADEAFYCDVTDFLTDEDEPEEDNEHDEDDC